MVSRLLRLALCALPLILAASGPASAQVVGTDVEEPTLPPGVDPFNLDLDQTRMYSRSKNFEVVGHSYFKGPWLSPLAKDTGLGAGFNSLRVYDGIAYLGGYNTPATLFGTLIADVHDPAAMEPLSFVPCNPGTRCPYVRVNQRRKILVGTQDTSSSNPNEVAAGVPAPAGVSFVDVSDLGNPQPLGFFQTRPGGATHGFDIDDRYVYTCANRPESKPGGGSNQELVIVDYNDPTNPVLTSTLHIQGQHEGEEFAPQDQPLADGTPQALWCHEIIKDRDRLYIAWRDAGLVIVDVSNPSQPKVISRLDYVPPFSSGGGGAAHTSAPVSVSADQYPKLVVNTDEIFTCPPGFGRIVDISDLANPVVLSTYRLPGKVDNYDFTTGKFICPGTVQSIHTPWFDYRSPSLFYQAWYDQGMHAWDISNPFAPTEVGYYISPPYPCKGSCGGNDPNGGALRHAREVFQDPQTGLIYLTDGNGGGLTVLRYTGPIPTHPPIPGAR